MKEKKTEFRIFTVPEWKKEERYLRERHKNGWEFSSVTFPGFYHFTRCEPKDVVYQLDFNQESETNRSEYIQIFSDCGWEYLQNFCGYSYFRKAASEMNGTEEEIFCDDASRLDMMKRVFMKRITPLLGIFFLMIIPQIMLQSRFNRPENHVLLGIFCIMFVVYLAFFIVFGIQYWKCFKDIHR
ncbi:MAG: DUF2812 domain-containing protein [Coprococcus sp.]|nr:DUF2812 domain-containing protein [Coprococcus sp.]